MQDIHQTSPYTLCFQVRVPNNLSIPSSIAMNDCRGDAHRALPMVPKGCGQAHPC